jgi:hypothetical protein
LGILEEPGQRRNVRYIVVHFHIVVKASLFL